jgi:DNA-binding NarL/FixJ family response regulator
MYPITSLPHNETMVLPECVRAITVSEQAVHANALALLLGTSAQIDVVASETRVKAARTAILRSHPDVVVIRTSESNLYLFCRLFDLQRELPELGFVIVLDEETGGSARRAPLHRATVVLPADFSLAALLSSVMSAAGHRPLVGV